MSQNYSGRITLIAVVLLAALVAIFWPSITNPSGVAFNGNVPLSQKLNLKPGIDISGGTSLLYEIKTPEGGAPSPTLAEDVTKALKKRVDPNGVLNLIWRPQNPNRLEIQMPLSGVGGENARRQKALTDAGAQLESTNVRVSEAIAWVERAGEIPISATTAPSTSPATLPDAAPPTHPHKSQSPGAPRRHRARRARGRHRAPRQQRSRRFHPARPRSSTSWLAAVRCASNC